MKNSDRQIIFDKFGGRCAYCGCELVKGWHIDHIEPVNRISKRKDGYYRNKVTKKKIEQKDLPDKWFVDYEYINPTLVFDKMQYPERDTIENSMPACYSCNNYKSTFGLELFRQQIGLLISRLNKSFTQYKIAKRYGLVQENINPIIFYFEKYENQLKTQ